MSLALAWFTELVFCVLKMLKYLLFPQIWPHLFKFLFWHKDSGNTAATVSNSFSPVSSSAVSQTITSLAVCNSTKIGM